MKKRKAEDIESERLCHSPHSNYQTTDGLENALEDTELTCWLWWVFFLGSTPGILHMWHDTVYVFIGGILPYWCDVEQLHRTNWTESQIRTIVTGDRNVSSCTGIHWNYTQLSGLDFKEAVKVTRSVKIPERFECHKFGFDGSSITSEWGLVCNKATLRTLVQVFPNFGDIFAGFVLGFIGDKYGRRRAFAWSSLIFVVCSLTASFTSSYPVFVTARIGIGMAATGTYNAAFTILTELCGSRHRALPGALMNLSFAVAMMTLPLIATKYEGNWQGLQLAISLPSLLLLFVHSVFLPESPRWLISQGRRQEAWEIIKKVNRGSTDIPIDLAVFGTEQTHPRGKRDVTQSFWLSTLRQLFGSAEMIWRFLISIWLHLVTYLVFYSIALNGTNLKLDRFIYMGLAGAASAVGYFLPFPLLQVLGRRSCCCILFICAAVSLLVIMSIPQGTHWLLLSAAMTGQVCITATFTVVVLFTSELFPVNVRSTAIGGCSVGANVGAMMAPFLVDILGERAWYIPSTVCGMMSMGAALLVLLLPETRHQELSESVEALGKQGERVSVDNCCNWN